ncbi:hypothetical protein [Rhodobium gokarnense]|uniref:Uncharacterized protein n=1 Tax=Rhodobium gokarnense TaxID=364296 RepID=A0ABT3HHX2_9HYPH|nr:hypothetical protein [Rhodobium gokarnense]MCW2309997.1 hypothetical protein [Rhodobium gokarnense]
MDRQVATAANAAADALSPERLVEANIHPESLLATDYLNHFNEIIMLMEMLPEMPDCAEDVLAWEPCSYQQHFEVSGFKDRDLAILAYESAPAAIRADFDTTIARIDGHLVAAQNMLREAEPGDFESHGRLAALAVDELRPLISRARALVHGEIAAMPSIDDASEENTQSAIDELFE